jgi:phytoene synthase
VLEVFGCANAQTEPLSDDVCSALQLLEHCQDVAEDLGNGRIYLPADDLARFGCDPATLSAPTASKQLREVIRFQVDRARELLASGSLLVSRLHGAARIAVAGYVAGGLATARAIERCDYDVLANQAGPARRHIVSSWLRLMIAAMFSSSRPRGSRRASTALPGRAA